MVCVGVQTDYTQLSAQQEGEYTSCVLYVRLQMCECVCECVCLCVSVCVWESFKGLG